MKILIATLPRTGSKFLQINLHSYLQAIGPVTKMIHPIYDSINGLGEFLNPINIKKQSERTGNEKPMFKYTASLTDDFDVAFTECLVDKDIEVENRLAILQRLQKPYVMKEIIFPTNYAKLLFDGVDSVYTIRKDIKDWVVSVIVARHTGIYTKNSAIKGTIKSFSENKIVVDRAMVEQILTMEDTYRSLQFPMEKTKVLSFEEVISISDSKRFCELLELPFVEFDFINDTVEFGEQKYDMILNLDEVDIWIDEHLATQK